MLSVKRDVIVDNPLPMWQRSVPGRIRRRAPACSFGMARNLVKLEVSVSTV